MGICLDTEQNDGSQTFEEGHETWVQNTPRGNRAAVTPSAGKFPMLNKTNVAFEEPKVPVIFVLGGPGSGKVTHCDSLTQEKKGIAHINMTDLLQQYAIGNDMQDFGLLSSKTVTEVLMLEMKMAPNAKTYLISGYPRNMRDVVEYSEKIQMVNGVILISWRQKVLERQIDYGAKLGQVVLSLARMELNNFYKNVMPVADYFDQSNMLISVNGERHPTDVYKDFREAVFKILGEQDNPPVFANGRVVNSVPADVTSELPTMQSTARLTSPPRPQTLTIPVSPQHTSPVKPQAVPPVIFVLGGPGSGKAALCAATAKANGWRHVSLGSALRTMADPPDPRQRTGEVAAVREAVSGGELVDRRIVMRVLEGELTKGGEGVILDGFPRSEEQVRVFEERFQQKPHVILLDCSKLQLGRGRLDDSVTAFRRRLEIFRQESLPMLKAMDNVGRLTIVDGDTDTAPVREDFKNVVKEHVEYSKAKADANGHSGDIRTNGHIPNGRIPDAEVEDLESEPIETISQHVGNGVANAVANGVRHMANGYATNNLVPKTKPLTNGYNGSLPTYASLERGNNYNPANYMDSHI